MGAHFLPVEEGQEIESCDYHTSSSRMGKRNFACVT